MSDVLNTEYGSIVVSEHGVTVYGIAPQLYRWAHRPDAVWPCSALAADEVDEVVASFDSRGDLVGLEGETYALGADELSAWTSDVLRLAGLASHPAIR